MPHALEQVRCLPDAGWKIFIDSQWQNVTVRIPTDGTRGCIFASIAPESIVIYSLGAGDERNASDPIDSIRHLPLPFKVVPESSSARFEESELVLILPGLMVEAESAVELKDRLGPASA
jgi:hypothetical protein